MIATPPPLDADNFKSWCRAVVREFVGPSRCHPQRIAELARGLAESGPILRTKPLRADIASTGGPGSLTTLIGPFYLAQAGYEVIKVGVPGRPAGAIDVLGSIPGYVASLSSGEIEAASLKSRVVSTLPSSFAPADRVLFEYRQRHQAQSVPSLVIASLLSKKLAVGLTQFVIEIRQMSGGNFGSSEAECRTNAELLQAVAELLGMDAHTPIKAYDSPPQPYFGRLESLIALLKLIDGEPDTWLASHAAHCKSLAALLPPVLGRDPAPLADLVNDHLLAQGVAGLNALRANVATRTAASDHVLIRASDRGRISWNTAAIRSLLVDEQRRGRVQFPDPVGMYLLVPSGDVVEPQQPIAELRISNPASPKTTLGNAYAIYAID